MDIINGSQVYKVGARRAKNGKCILYLCTQEATMRECLLQIAVDKKFNADIDRNAYILRILNELASLAEREYQKIPENKEWQTDLLVVYLDLKNKKAKVKIIDNIVINIL